MSENLPLDPELLEILACPETKDEVVLASPEQLLAVNQRIRQGTQFNRAGRRVEEELQSGLVRRDGRVLFPVRDGIPIMLIEEALDLS